MKTFDCKEIVSFGPEVSVGATLKLADKEDWDSFRDMLDAGVPLDKVISGRSVASVIWEVSPQEIKRHAIASRKILEMRSSGNSLPTVSLATAYGSLEDVKKVLSSLQNANRMPPKMLFNEVQMLPHEIAAWKGDLPLLDLLIEKIPPKGCLPFSLRGLEAGLDADTIRALMERDSAGGNPSMTLGDRWFGGGHEMGNSVSEGIRYCGHHEEAGASVRKFSIAGIAVLKGRSDVLPDFLKYLETKQFVELEGWTEELDGTPLWFATAQNDVGMLQTLVEAGGGWRTLGEAFVSYEKKWGVEEGSAEETFRKEDKGGYLCTQLLSDAIRFRSWDVAVELISAGARFEFLSDKDWSPENRAGVESAMLRRKMDTSSFVALDRAGM